MRGAPRPSDAYRFGRLLCGLFLYAVGIVLTVHANLGASPWDVFHLGLAEKFGLTFGVTNIAVSVVVVTIAALMGERIGIGTLCNVVSIGVFIDLLRYAGWVPEMRSFVPGVAMLVAGLFVIAFATVLYIGAEYGAGPRDSLMVALTRLTGRPAGFCRCCVEGTVLFFGWLLGGVAGIGTLIAALGIGVAVQVAFGLAHFDVKRIRHESLADTWRRMTRRETAAENNFTRKGEGEE
jgi:Predicted membrane protein